MKKLIACLTVTFIIILAFAKYNQVLNNNPEPKKNDSAEFYRLLTFNDKNELMVVKIKGTDFWVTPGLYSDEKKSINKKSINKQLQALSADYGLITSQPELHGKFILKAKNNNKSYNRYFYRVNVKSGKVKMPKIIGQIKWLPIDEAIQIITFPHIKQLIQQITDYPETVWGGTILRYKEEGQLKAKMLEKFYPIKQNEKGKAGIVSPLDAN